MKFAVAIVLCLVSLIHAQPHRGGGGHDGGRPGGFRPDGPRPHFPGLALSTWNRTVGGQNLRESGFANATKSVVMVRSGDGRGGAETLYDFSGASVLAVVRVGPGCVVIPADASVTTFAAAAAEVNNRNGTTIGAPAGSVQLDATAGTPSTASSEAITLFCHDRQPVIAVLAGAGLPAPGSEPAGQRVLSFNTLDTSVQLLVAAPAGRPEGRPEGRHQGRPEGRPGSGGSGGPNRG